MQLTRMAWRNVWRNPRRSWVTMAAMTLGLVVMIGYSGLVQGYLAQMERQILELELGDLQIHAKGYRTDPSLFTHMKDADAIVGKLEGAGFRASGRLLGAGLAAAADNSSGAMIVGVDPVRDAKVSEVHSRVAKGTWLDASKPKGVVIGRYLARTLELAPGGEIILLSQAADGSSANDVYTVAGVLGTVGQGVDQAGVFMTEAAFRQLLVLDQGAHRVIVRAPEGMTNAEALAKAEALVPDHDVQSWRALLPMFAQMFDSVQGVMAMMFLIIFTAVGVVLLNTMLMAVFERIREIGVLKALGYSPGAVVRLVLLESGIQTGIAVALGLCVSVPLLWYLSQVGLDMGEVSIQGVTVANVWKAEVTPQTFATPMAVLVFVISASVAYPAIKAAVIRPVEAIRHR